MARDVIDRQLTARSSRAQFTVAAAGDDAEIRRLLRDNPMAGQISISIEREPGYFADADLPGEDRQTIIARKDGRLVCLGHCVIRQRFINGTPCRVGYLGGLRLDAQCAGRFDVLRRGYEFFRGLQADSPADFYFTSIASDNVRARWFLERGLPGMPTYEYIGDFVTLILPARKRQPGHALKKTGAVSWIKAVIAWNHHNCRYQLAPHWSEQELASLDRLGLGCDDFYQIEKDNRSASAAIWDQRSFKQTVIRGYASPLKQARSVLNFASSIVGGIRLPAIGETLANAFILNAIAEDPEGMVHLIETMSEIAARRKIHLLTLGFAANDSRLSWLRHKFRCREYHSRLYLVHWPELGGAAGDLDERILCPEVAWL